MVPPKDSIDYGKCLWLLLTATHGLVNANARFQSQNDNALQGTSFNRVKVIPQLFEMNRDIVMIVLLCKIVGDLLLTGEDNAARHIAETFHQKFELGTMGRGPAKTSFCILNLVQHDDFSISVDGDDKLRDT